jgi:glycosyltransferase involved in cell wall biosynthesis
VKIVHVVALVSDDGAYGGPTTVATGQLGELARRGHGVVLAALWRGRTDPPSTVDDVPVQLFPARTMIPGAGLLGLLHPRLVRWLWREARGADVVHVHAGRNVVTLAALLVCALRRAPYVVQTHGMVMPRRHPRARLVDLLLVPLLRRARHRFVLTDIEASGLTEVVGARWPTERLPNGIDVPEVGPRQLADPGQVVFLARLHPRKRVDAFLDAAEVLIGSGSSAQFMVYGPDEGCRPLVQQRLTEGPLVGRVVDGGALDHDGALDALARADVYVLPSRDEPFPITLLEAIARGTPSVCTTSCGVAGTLQERRAGVVTDGSPAELAKAIEALLADRDEWRHASQRAQQAARVEFSVAAVVDRLLAAYVG